MFGNNLKITVQLEFSDLGVDCIWQMRVLVSREFLESIEKNVICQRPASRVDAAKVDTECDSVLLMSDHSVFPHGNFHLIDFGQIIILISAIISLSHRNIYSCAFLTSVIISKQVKMTLGLKACFIATIRWLPYYYLIWIFYFFIFITQENNFF